MESDQLKCEDMILWETMDILGGDIKRTSKKKARNKLFSLMK